MPIYEYECEKCGAVFEMMQTIAAKPLKKCQGAGCNNKDNGKVHRLVSAAGFILKGSGWYTSDYPSEARKQGWEAESKHASSAPAGADAAPKSEAASTAAPETPKTTKPKPIEKKPAQKNPYSGRGGKKVKTGK
ncbi:MAG: FmdB family zinc ribbon protein [Nitrospinaceae bacterium]